VKSESDGVFFMIWSIYLSTASDYK